MMFNSETDRKVGIGLTVLIGFLLVGTIFFNKVEGWSWINSVYFSVVTLSTIGYGDLVPMHDITKIFLMFYIILGVSTVLYVFTTLGSYYMEKHSLFVEKTAHSVKHRTKDIQNVRKHLYAAREDFRKGIVGRKERKKSIKKLKTEIKKLEKDAGIKGNN